MRLSLLSHGDKKHDGALEVQGKSKYNTDILITIQGNRKINKKRDSWNLFLREMNIFYSILAWNVLLDEVFSKAFFEAFA